MYSHVPVPVSWFRGWFVVIVLLFVLSVVLLEYIQYGTYRMMTMDVQLSVSIPVNAGKVWCLRKLGLESWVVHCRYL